jgi:hypothetical protein
MIEAACGAMRLVASIGTADRKFFQSIESVTPRMRQRWAAPRTELARSSVCLFCHPRDPRYPRSRSGAWKSGPRQLNHRALRVHRVKPFHWNRSNRKAWKWVGPIPGFLDSGSNPDRSRWNIETQNSSLLRSVSPAAHAAGHQVRRCAISSCPVPA